MLRAQYEPALSPGKSFHYLNAEIKFVAILRKMIKVEDDRKFEELTIRKIKNNSSSLYLWGKIFFNHLQV